MGAMAHIMSDVREVSVKRRGHLIWILKENHLVLVRASVSQAEVTTNAEVGRGQRPRMEVESGRESS